MENKALIKEIFESIQGEGPYIGYNQLFIRFGKCNLKCKYCDTDFENGLREYTADDLLGEIRKHKNIHSVSLTGGEPLEEVEFLSVLLPKIDYPIYLETNGTLYKNLERIIQYVDIISADIKLNSASDNGNLFELHERFINTASRNKKEIFVKIVFDENITDIEIKKSCELAEKYSLPVILQPKTDGNVLKISNSLIESVFFKFLSEYKNVRVIPQVHKFLNVR